MSGYLKAQEETIVSKKETVQLIVPSDTPIIKPSPTLPIIEEFVIEPIVEKKNTEVLAATKIATTFNTNRTYVNEAKRIKEEKTEILEQIKSGEKMTIKKGLKRILVPFLVPLNSNCLIYNQNCGDYRSTITI